MSEATGPDVYASVLLAMMVEEKVAAMLKIGKAADEDTGTEVDADGMGGRAAERSCGDTGPLGARLKNAEAVPRGSKSLNPEARAALKR